MLQHSPGQHAGVLGGTPPVKRDILLFMRGDVGDQRLTHYSRGVRQAFARLSRAGLHANVTAAVPALQAWQPDVPWSQRYRVLVDSYDNLPGNYQQMLS